MSRFAIIVLLAAVLVVVQTQAKDVQYPLCPVNQFFDLCGNECEPSCSDPTWGQHMCVGCTNGPGACKCKDGYVRKGDACVTLDQC